MDQLRSDVAELTRGDVASLRISCTVVAIALPGKPSRRRPIVAALSGTAIANTHADAATRTVPLGSGRPLIDLRGSHGAGARRNAQDHPAMVVPDLAGGGPWVREAAVAVSMTTTVRFPAEYWGGNEGTRQVSRWWGESWVPPQRKATRSISTFLVKQSTYPSARWAWNQTVERTLQPALRIVSTSLIRISESVNSSPGFIMTSLVSP
jgi:hypothetical protein